MSRVGLRNVRTICYLNAILQLFYSVAPLRHHFMYGAGVTAKPGRSVLGALYLVMQGLFEHELAGDGVPVDPSRLADALFASSKFRRAAHEDAHELLLFLLEKSDQADLRALQLDMEAMGQEGKPEARQTMVSLLFAFQFRTTTHCACGHESIMEETHLDLPVDCQPARAGARSLSYLIERLLRDDALAEGSVYHCDACTKAQGRGVSLRRAFVSLPAYLLVSLKRYEADGSKNGARIVYSTELRLAAAGGEQALYELEAVVCHMEHKLSRHYIVLSRVSPLEFCVFDDDEEVRMVGIDELRKTFGGHRTAYILCYKRIT